MSFNYRIGLHLDDYMQGHYKAETLCSAYKTTKYPQWSFYNLIMKIDQRPDRECTPLKGLRKAAVTSLRDVLQKTFPKQ